MSAWIIDTETASIKGGICDIAAVEIDEGFNILRSYESLIDPEMPIHPEASGIHHITDDMVVAEPTLDEFMGIYGPLFLDGDIFIGHNVSFDCRVLASVMPSQFRMGCTLKLARNLWPTMESHKLQTLRYHFKLDAGTAHRAMGDVRVCHALIRMVGEAEGCGLAGVLELMRKPLSLDNKMPFGKHRGEKLKDLPLSYVRWLLGNATELDPDIREALSSRLK